MKSSLAFVLVLVLILGIIIPSGVTAAAVPESTPQESVQIVKLLKTIKSVFGIDVSTLEHRLSHLKEFLLHLRERISDVEFRLDHFKTLINEITE